MQAEKRKQAASTAQEGIVLIEARQIADNLKILKERIRVPIMAVVKNNGYGLGLKEYALFLQRQGVSKFGVKDAREATELRAAGISAEIYLLAPVLDIPELVRLIRADVVLSIDSAMAAGCAKRAGYLAGQMPAAQIVLDTGLGRYGFLPGQTEQAADAALYFRLKGIYTHFAEPYRDAAFTKKQYARFLEQVEQLRGLGVQPPMLHCCATAGALRFPKMQMDLVRIGSGLLGRTPDAEKLGLCRVGKIGAQVAEVKELPEGWNVGYGKHARLKKPCKVGIVQAGAQAGFFVGRQEAGIGTARYLARAARAFFGKKRHYVSIRGQKAPVLGMVGLNHIAVDLSKVACRAGEFAYAACNPVFCPEQMPRLWREA